nr:hypothetical protein [uncultured Anaerotignum sp.]
MSDFAANLKQFRKRNLEERLQVRRAAFLDILSGLWGRVWKGKPCCPFLGCGGLEPITKGAPK